MNQDSIRSKNPFDSNYNKLYEDNDEYSNFGNREQNYSRDDSNELKQLQQRIGQVENDSVESTYRALRSLNEARETGQKTAEELVRQGEQLNNINEKLDEVDKTLTTTQKNINQIKSVFGGLKNRFMGSRSSSSNSISKEKPKSTNTKNQTIPQSSSFVNQNNLKGTYSEITGSDREKEINKNLDEMSAGLSVLNSLARDMKTELERQDPLLDIANGKLSHTHNRITSQDKQMKKIK